MKLKKRIVVKRVLNHCYQRTAGGVLIFYSISDYLVLFTIFCLAARKHRVRVLSVSFMPDHLHHCTLSETRDDLSGFVRDYSHLFSQVHNKTCHTRGPLFESPFGSVPKKGDKKVRTNLIYVGNNAPERNLCKKAEDYRWNFLAYAQSKNPYSDPLVLRNASYHLRRAINEIRAQYKRNNPLTYALLQRLLGKLNRQEKEQLVDFIISTYNVIDYPSAISFFGSYEQMLIALHSTTGNEYELKESFCGKSDACYAKLCRILTREYHFADIHDVLALPEKERFAILLKVQGRTDATVEQLSAFFRIRLSTRDVEVIDL